MLMTQNGIKLVVIYIGSLQKYIFVLESSVNNIGLII